MVKIPRQEAKFVPNIKGTAFSGKFESDQLFAKAKEHSGETVKIRK